MLRAAAVPVEKYCSVSLLIEASRVELIAWMSALVSPAALLPRLAICAVDMTARSLLGRAPTATELKN